MSNSSNVDEPATRPLHFNVGIIGHVDAGKTALAKRLTSIVSTACHDKHPQAQARGMTIDLGFSALTLPSGQLVTLVDCPGHSGLIRAVLMAANIIDALLLVVDGVQGIQKQTVECLALQCAVRKPLLVVINKIDDPLSKYAKLHDLFQSKFQDVPIVGVSAITGEGIEVLVKSIEALMNKTDKADSHKSGEFVAIIDHCFQIKGVGPVVTGTCIQGACQVGDSLILDNAKVKVKTMQSFKQNITKCGLGDRVGFNLSGFYLDGLSSERTLLYSLGAIVYSNRVLCKDIKMVPYYKGNSNCFKRLHISIMNVTLQSRNIVFLQTGSSGYVPTDSIAEATVGLLEFDVPVPILQDLKFIASRLDLEDAPCRLAFYGSIIGPAPELKVVTERSKILEFERWHKPGVLLVRGLTRAQVERFIKDTVEVTYESGVDRAHIMASFGASNKVLIQTRAVGRISSIILKYKKEFLV